jgi:hypothetical protein
MKDPAREESSRRYAADYFGINFDEVVWYNGGICYSRVVVLTKEAAERVREKVKNDTVNGGYLHGMPLGGITEINRDGVTSYDVMC